MKIANRIIEYGKKPIISAELSLNHHAHLPTALKMIDEAYKAGAGAIKLQYYVAENFCSAENEEMITYGCEGKETTERLYSLFKRHEISIDFVKTCMARTKKYGLIFHATPTSANCAKELAEIGTDAFKVSSDMVDNKCMLNEMDKHNLPKIISTGYIKDITKWPKKDNLYLHCVSEYPCRDAKLHKIAEMKKLGYLTGYSHHGYGIKDCLEAIKLDVLWVEVHFRIDDSAVDGFALASEELSKLTKAAK